MTRCALTGAVAAAALLGLGGFYAFATLTPFRVRCAMAQVIPNLPSGLSTPSPSMVSLHVLKPEAQPSSRPSLVPSVGVVKSRCKDPIDTNDTTAEQNCTPRPRCKKMFSQVMGGVRCPNDVWVGSMVRMDPDPDKVILNIGCNKGHDAIQWLQRFDQHRFWNLGNWAKSMPRGYCTLGTGVPHPPKYESFAVPLAICVEAMPVNVELLKKVQAEKNYTPNSTHGFGRLEILHYAVLDVAGPGATVEFVDGEPGKESCGLGAVGCKKNKRVQVPANTVDQIVKSLALTKVDVLLIDTEGADPLVLRGATETLKSVRYLMFETHRDLKESNWEITPIRSVVQSLAAYGFECYWMGENGKTFSVTECFESDFEKVGMGNIACVKKDDLWFAALDKHDPNSGFNV